MTRHSFPAFLFIRKSPRTHTIAPLAGFYMVLHTVQRGSCGEVPILKMTRHSFPAFLFIRKSPRTHTIAPLAGFYMVLHTVQRGSCGEVPILKMTRHSFPAFLFIRKSPRTHTIAPLAGFYMVLNTSWCLSNLDATAHADFPSLTLPNLPAVAELASSLSFGLTLSSLAYFFLEMTLFARHSVSNKGETCPSGVRHRQLSGASSRPLTDHAPTCGMVPSSNKSSSILVR
ncbi:hypothetical protein K439DRAFT_1164922 [Ramaria rubella]|nr:hypothetical protein K439DRAFT_1164922 [Ramaria rubella]